jgi:putative Mg2+ transporter-C (MgtC) family protein
MNDGWLDVFRGVVADFSDLPNLATVLRVSVRLLLAAVLGGLLGYERESIGKAAGIRTHMLVSLGAALFVLIPSMAGMSNADLSRVVQGLVAGIGFLGAGTILKQSEQQTVQGLTTATGIWLTAAVGVAAGLGREATATLGTLLALVILRLGPRLGNWTQKPPGRILTSQEPVQDRPGE